MRNTSRTEVLDGLSILERQPRIHSGTTVRACDISFATHLLLHNLEMLIYILHITHLGIILLRQCKHMSCIFPGQIDREERLFAGMVVACEEGQC